ncbi:MAG TPA: hypothetical protein VHZ03_27940 [Trebonia sp.]|nr:hypothetical protein [Trebonia sp.]
MNHHPVKRLTAPDGSRVNIDVQLAPLIKALWAAGYETIGCCQDVGQGISASVSNASAKRRGTYWKGYALLEMPVEDMCKLLDAVKGTPQFKDRMHWADQGAWEIAIQVAPFGFDGAAEPVPWAQLRFPNDQISDLVDVIREAG